MPLPRPPEEPEGLLAGLPQLGLAAYALLVLAMMGCSSLCMGATVYGLFTASPSVSGLKSNADVEVWRLGLLRQAGALAEGEVPLLYHDHSSFFDGSAGCMVVGDALVRWDGGVETGRVAIPGARVEARGASDAPTVTVGQGEVEVACPFGAGEGGDRFLRMLRTEAQRAGAP